MNPHLPSSAVAWTNCQHITSWYNFTLLSVAGFHLILIHSVVMPHFDCFCEMPHFNFMFTRRFFQYFFGYFGNELLSQHHFCILSTFFHVFFFSSNCATVAWYSCLFIWSNCDSCPAWYVHLDKRGVPGIPSSSLLISLQQIWAICQVKLWQRKGLCRSLHVPEEYLSFWEPALLFSILFWDR